jgi:hypothetical protein
MRRDDGGIFTVASTTTVIPAHAGIQWLCFVDEHYMNDLREQAA